MSKFPHINGMRLFQWYYHSVVEMMGADPSDILPVLDLCKSYQVTRKDLVDFEVLMDMLNEFYGLTEEGWEEWR